ncbi:MAG: hypothetical protein ABIR91_04165 [Candidatus Saccharimonadales bacterium]
MTERMEYFREGRLHSGQEYAVYGRAKNGPVNEYDNNIVSIGEDVALVVPRHDLFAVFDGAGGTADIGSPLQAAMTAADAVRTFAKYHVVDSPQIMGEMMEFARRAVKADLTAVLCVRAIAKSTTKYIWAVNAGDTGGMRYDTDARQLQFEVEQQSNAWNPNNYLGRDYRRVAAPQVGDAVYELATLESGQEFYIASDGVIGNYHGSTGVEEYTMQAAHEAYQEFAAMRRVLPNMKPRMDWDEWGECNDSTIGAGAYVHQRIGSRALLSSLAERPIAWEFERINDDATVILVRPQDS